MVGRSGIPREVPDLHARETEIAWDQGDIEGFVEIEY
jgi:hypothetical protein